ncbi:MAG: helicase-related protein [Anaerolineae bacterium]
MTAPIHARVCLIPENRIATVFRWEPYSGWVRIGLIFEDTSEALTLVLREDEIDQRLKFLPSLRETFATAERLLPREQVLAFADALRMRLAYTFDPHYAVSVTQVDLLPHQVDAVYRYILTQPRVRFLIADDPGLGKTIMAGLVLKELKVRGLVRRILIIVPAHLQDQWQREMQDWFREDFTILNRGVTKSLLTADFFERNSQVLVSMDFARQEEIRDLLARIPWDLVVVDEAHKFSATRYGQKIRKTKRYQLGEAIAHNASHLLFLTATPHKGDDEAYFLLLNLLQPRLFARSDSLKRASRSDGLPFVLRRSKEQVTDLEGRPLFKRRQVQTLPVALTEAERRLYDAVTAYVRRWYRVVAAQSDRRSRNVALALTVLQRRLSSSLFAIRESLRRRQAKLRNLLQEWERRQDEEALPELDDEYLEELSEQTDAEREDFQEKLEGLTAAQTPEELREEIAELDDLIRLAQEAEKAGEEAKVNELRRVVEEHLRRYPEEKLIVFTEFKDTLMALRRKVEQEWGFPVAVIHGEMNLQARIDQERYFRDHTQVLIGTDAAGEGLNLQFARLMVNFDLPWNPNRLEQRMGRIHRYGQKRDCFVFNMLYSETREGEVLKRLLEKLERMRERLGDSVYDVIGQLMEGVRLEEVIMRAILQENAAGLEQMEADLEKRLEERLEEYRRALEENALAGYHIDLSSVQANDRGSRHWRLVPWDVERFTTLAASFIGGECRPDLQKPGVFHLSVPRTFLRQHNLSQESFATGVRIAFERKVARDARAEFFAPGHPLLEALCEHFLQRDRPVQAALVHPQGEQGVLWFFRGRVQDGTGQPVLERLLTLFWNAQTQQAHEVDPRILWDLQPWPDGAPLPDGLLNALDVGESSARRHVLELLDRLRAEAAQRREREVGIKKRWLEESFGDLLAESNAKLVEYSRRAEWGEDMGVAIRQEEENYKRLVWEREERLKALEQEQALTVLEPQLEAVVLVCAPPSAEAERPQMEADVRRIEAIGMEVAIQHERQQGREPTDVSKEYLGYDIRSEGGGETRYIEVKAFATTGDVRFTPHEWQMAQRLGDEYWLYVVGNAVSEPRLYQIQNPAARLHLEPEMGVVGYVDRDWKKSLPFSGGEDR